MSESIEISVANSIPAMTAAVSRVRRFLEGRSVGRRAVHAAEITIEELLSNTIRYGYADEGAHEILVSVDCGSAHVRLEIRDDAEAFDPLGAPPPRRAASITDAVVGGLGILMVRRLATDMRYERRGAHNHLTVLIDAVDRRAPGPRAQAGG